MKRFAASVVVIACAVASPFVFSAEKKPVDPNGPSPTLSYSAYMENVGRVTVVVGSAINATVKSDEFLPLEVAVLVSKDGEELEFDYNSFAITDPAGNVYRLSAPKAVADNKQFWMESQNYVARRRVPVSSITYNARRVSSLFYDRVGHTWGGSNLVTNTYFQDVVFFPRPPNLEGVFTMRVNTLGMEGPVEVRFEIPSDAEKGGSEKKDKKKDKDKEKTDDPNG